MKNLILTLSALLMVSCGVSSSASKVETFSVDAASELPALSGADVWTLNGEESKLEFVATHNSREFTGVFKNFSAAIKLDPNAPETGRIEAVIDLSSVDAGDRDRNANLPTKDWFHTANFPLATFSSDKITAIAGDDFEAAGRLKLKGVSKPVKLMFSLQVEGDQAVAVGSANLNRTDFNVGEGPDFEAEDWVKFPVVVKFKIVASK